MAGLGHDGGTDSMGRIWLGTALALALQHAAVPSVSAEQRTAETSPPLHFVGDARLLAGVNPNGQTADRGNGASDAGNAGNAAPAKSAITSTASWPVTLHEVRAQREVSRTAKAEVWSADEVKTARLRCQAILKEIGAVAEIEEPIRMGSCGTPAPIRLTSIGSKPAVTISPPALVNCDMAEALHKWIVTGLQPLARKHLGAPIVRIEKMSDFSCRNAYGKARGKLSEHGRANALDISGFATSNGEQALLLADWGLTARDVRALAAAARKEPQKVIHPATPAIASVPATTTRRTLHVPSAAAMAASGIRRDDPAPRDTLAEGLGGERDATTLTFAGESRGDTVRRPLDGLIGKLGGYVPPSSRAAQAERIDSIVRQVGELRVTAPAEANKAAFLRGAHDSACGIFGTVLGPEANNAHRNHLHVDLAVRGKTGAFCQ